MALDTRRGEGVLPLTLERLIGLYKQGNIAPGKLVRVGIKPQWTLVMGSGQECGIATNITGILPSDNTPADSLTVAHIRKMINRPLFEVAAAGIRSDDLLERSLGIAAMSALSQRFLSCTGVRSRGMLSQCWKAADPFVLQYPMISRFVTMDDVVAVIGHGAEVRELRGRCRELHVMDIRISDIFSTVLIGSSVEYGPRDIIIHRGRQDTEMLRSADVIFIDASSLVDGTFADLIRHTAKARLVGLCGLCGSLIPDAFFDQGLDFVSSVRITDPDGFSDAMTNEHDMEYALVTGQKQYLMTNPSTMSGKSGVQDPSACITKA